jgi:DNA repair protein RecN (Recombination protein N)
MLTSLDIRNVVLIEHLALNFSAGLSVLTGETGAGKSILLDALGLALGQRSEAKLLRSGAGQATVTAGFDLPKNHPAFALLEESGIESEGGLILRRTLSPDGRTRAFVNDTAIGVNLLRALGETLVEVHGQFQTHGLLDAAVHRRLLDAYGRLGPQRDAVAHAWETWRSADAALAETRGHAERARNEESFLRHAVEELDQLSPTPGEEKILDEKRTALMNAGKIEEALNSAFADLAGPQGAETRLGLARRALDKLAGKDGGKLGTVSDAIARTEAELQEAIRALQAIAHGEGGAEDSLEDIEDRLFKLRACARKHGVEIAALAALREEFGRRLNLIEDGSARLTALAKAAEAARGAYRAAADALSAARSKTATALDRAVMEELPPLKLEKARFETSVTSLSEAEAGPEGMDAVSFQVATNPGSAAGPMAKIASGGELARFMLALRVVLARVSAVPVLVFDEADSGIGGAVADAVGERLARLSQSVQVLAITHSPQVAARGGHHWHVAKATRKGETRTDVVALDAAARCEEIARMLSGATITNEARAAAARLLDAASAPPPKRARR